MMEAKLQRLVAKGLLPPKEVTRWRATAGEVLLNPWLGEMVSFTDLHECRFGIPASDFL